MNIKKTIPFIIFAVILSVSACSDRNKKSDAYGTFEATEVIISSEAMGRILSANKEVPVIINTAYSNYKDSFMSWAADAYIVKSSDLSELKGKIKEVLANRGKNS